MLTGSKGMAAWGGYQSTVDFYKTIKFFQLDNVDTVEHRTWNNSHTNSHDYNFQNKRNGNERMHFYFDVCRIT